MHYVLRLVKIALFNAAISLLAGQAMAQDYPNRPIRFVVPSTAGATSDLLARVIATEMSKIFGQPIVVDDKPGANQIIALENVARSPADGYTVGVVGVDGVVLLPLTTKALRFDPMLDLMPVAGLAEGRYVLAGSANRSWKNFSELVAFAKANPGKLNYGSSVHQVRFPIQLMIQRLGLDVVHIPYSGGAPYLQAIVGGTIDFGVISEGRVSAMGTRARLFAVTGQKRTASYPDIPTFSELNFPQVKGPSYSLSVRVGTPRAVIDKLSAAAAMALERPEVKTALANLYLESSYENPEVAAKSLGEQARFYAEFAKSINIQPE